MTTVRFEHVSKAFGDNVVLREVGVVCPDGKVTAIVGPNGAGKTTLLNVATGFVCPDAGRCLVGSREVSGRSPYKVARVGVARTFQSVRTVSHATVLENVLLAFPRQKGEGVTRSLLRFGLGRQEASNRREARAWLDRVGLAEVELRQAGELSYGQRKLLSLARCLATGARVLFLDEPVAGVQPDLRQRLGTLLRTLQEDGYSITFVEHDFNTVRDIADVAVVLDRGQVIAVGAPDSVLESARVVEAFLG